MASVGEIAEKVRSKNAGPFWLTVDVFCGSPEAYQTLRQRLRPADVARLFGADPATMKHFEIDDLNVIKFSCPRPAIQGTIGDRDMHGASWAALVAEFELP